MNYAALATQLANQLWAEKYAALYAAEIEAEQVRRAEAFVDGPRAVGPWILRQFTAYDVLIADGYRSPITCGDWRTATPEQLWWLAWLLRADLRAGRFARWRFERRMRRRHYHPDGTVTENFSRDRATMREYFESHFADARAPKRVDPKQPERQPELGVNWIASTVMALALETSWDEDHIKAMPLPRLWQYLTIIDRSRGGNADRFARAKRLRADCMREVNRILAERATSPAPMPASGS